METGKKDPTGGPKEERRRFGRISCSRFACSCSVRPESLPAGPGKDQGRGALLSDISPDGASFETNFRPTAGERMRIEIRPIEGPEVTAGIRVINSRRSERNGFYLVGSKFEEISELDKRNLLVLLDTISRMEQELAGP
ncbi:MAG: PilZ domain-containing protein [Candidatus Abyssubacteria bacterium]|nr:PilZ domain-containing protein [Candidatus Abyssubacteria bacterium]